MRIVSGIQPTSVPTLGNYIGAIKNFVKLQHDYPDAEIIVFIADLHSLTIRRDREELKKNIKALAGLYLACGLEKERTHIFLQSELPEHAELGFILECNTYMGELERMTQFKDKASKQEDGIDAGLFTYPCLMAADILIYNATHVPVGEDQKQHLELTRNIAERFNNKFGEVFTVPEPIISKSGSRIMSLQDPTRKMSKSDPNPKGFITLLDNVSDAKAKIKKAVTDSVGTVDYDKEGRPGISNLIDIYSNLTNLDKDEIIARYQGKGYAEFKTDLSEIVGKELESIQEKYNEIVKSGTINEVLDEGRDYCHHLASKTITKVKKLLGIYRG